MGDLGKQRGHGCLGLVPQRVDVPGHLSPGGGLELRVELLHQRLHLGGVRDVSWHDVPDEQVVVQHEGLLLVELRLEGRLDAALVELLLISGVAGGGDVAVGAVARSRAATLGGTFQGGLECAVLAPMLPLVVALEAKVALLAPGVERDLPVACPAPELPHALGRSIEPLHGLRHDRQELPLAGAWLWVVLRLVHGAPWPAGGRTERS